MVHCVFILCTLYALPYYNNNYYYYYCYDPMTSTTTTTATSTTVTNDGDDGMTNVIMAINILSCILLALQKLCARACIMSRRVRENSGCM